NAKVGIDLQINEERQAGFAPQVEADGFQDQQPGIEQMNGIESPTGFRTKPEKVISSNLYAKIKDFKLSSLSDKIYTTEYKRRFIGLGNSYEHKDSRSKHCWF